MPQIAKTARNRSIYLARESGQSLTAIAKRFDISIPRVSIIHAQELRRAQMRSIIDTLQQKPSAKDGDDLRALQLSMRAHNTLMRKFGRKVTNPDDPRDISYQLTIDEARTRLRALLHKTAPTLENAVRLLTRDAKGRRIPNLGRTTVQEIVGALMPEFLDQTTVQMPTLTRRELRAACAILQAHLVADKEPEDDAGFTRQDVASALAKMLERK